ncbi:MAG: phosphatidylglycerol lysyltransferase domain-containing protein, partial [Pseudomonadota bacterium]
MWVNRQSVGVFMQARQSAGAGLRRLWMVSRVGVPIAIGALCFSLVLGYLSPGAFEGLGQAVGALKIWQWLGAIAATGVSFWALARYDLVLHRHLQTRVPAQQATVTGAAAIAIGQTIGFGVISSAFVRWRMLPDLNLVEATKLSMAVAVTFLLGLLFSMGVLGLVGHSDVLSTITSLCFVFLFMIACLLAFLHPVLSVRHLRIALPSVKALLIIGGLTVIDVVFAGIAIWMLLPVGTDLNILVLLPAFIVALGAGIVTGAPGGIGPFELVLLLLLPQVPDQDLVVAIVSYRLVYYAAPTVVAAGLLARPFPRRELNCNRLVDFKSADLLHNRHAEMGLLLQPGAKTLRAREARIGVIMPGQSLCALFEPLQGTTEECLRVLEHLAHQRNMSALFYKANAQQACRARRLGWSVVHVADDMVIKLSRDGTNGPQYRQVRRKLRQADKAGVEIVMTPTPPWHDMAQLDLAWQTNNGDARTLTMGHFCPEYLRHQKIALAMHEKVLIGFASFHMGHSGLCLDLMRTSANAPSGTMHALIMAAISEARVL